MSSLGDRKREINMGDAVRRILEIAADGQREVSSWRDTAADPAAYEGIFERTAVNLRDAQKRLASERELAGARWESLASHPQPRRLVRIRNDRRFQTWGFYQFLLMRSRNFAADDPRTALEAADLALAVARCLDPKDYGEERIADFKCEALASIAEAKRGLADLDGAWRAFQEARTAMEDGTGDPLEKAELEHFRSRLLRDSGREEEAQEASRRAANLFRRIGDRRHEAEVVAESHQGRRAVQGRAARG